MGAIGCKVTGWISNVLHRESESESNLSRAGSVGNETLKRLLYMLRGICGRQESGMKSAPK
jgi:hypothetical protein